MSWGPTWSTGCVPEQMTVNRLSVFGPRKVLRLGWGGTHQPLGGSQACEFKDSVVYNPKKEVLSMVVDHKYLGEFLACMY